MERREFIKKCGFACFGLAAMGAILEGCAGTKNVTGAIVDSDITFSANDFFVMKDGEKKFRKNVIVHHNNLQYPICVFRTSETTYSAVLMKCTHQGAELQVYGDKLQCPAHGSEFTNTGVVLSPPADSNLRSFPAKEENNTIIISLK